ncbi:glycoside hydrolase family 43 protein [Nocardioides sp. GY 10127]|uniref:glycoside hydrolase family 43 protein n=1 Tax=Nocardioides sp. GY 10127 TaxID=2569762 RepID=UPI0010A9067A|nr:glycoside hydrolase family 43 protein [Nocardioides sp. GY 10127]TIC85476.1 glycoside hydrolase family 43 protein [Nocardioides sp. GY 10127]
MSVPATLPNPLLPGFNPDPSICRVGDDYYLCTSTFEYLPGLPVYHSTDMVTWTQIGNVATRTGQLDVEKVPTLGGAWAPTIRHRDGVFHVVVTDAFGRGTLHFTATDPAGPWSDGVVLEGIDGIDPDLTWDEDGTAFLTFSGLGVNPELDTFMSHRGLLQARVDLERGCALEEARSIWSGVGGQFPEAPHLYRIGEHWYLVIAEGGTERGHSVSVARADSPEGPFTEAPGTPLLSARGTNRPVQNTGHGDLVQTADGRWFLVLLGVRPRTSASGFSALGRETWAVPVTWGEDGWPSFEVVPLAPREGGLTWREDFTGPLGPQWLAVRQLPTDCTRVGDGGLVLTANDDDLSGRAPAFVGVRQTHQTASYTAVVDATAGSGGLAVRYDERYHYSLTVEPGRVVARGCLPSFEQVAELTLTGGQAAVELELTARRPEGDFIAQRTCDTVDLAVVVDGERHVLLSLDGRFLSSEVAESFTGRVVGLFATAGEVTVRSLSFTGSDE